jgi:predicted transcriptional regulator
MKLNKNDEQVVAALKASKELSMQEIADKTGVPSKKVFKSLKKLFENEMIDSMGRKYRLLSDKVPVKADDVKATAEAEEE